MMIRATMRRIRPLLRSVAAVFVSVAVLLSVAVSASASDVRDMAREQGGIVSVLAVSSIRDPAPGPVVSAAHPVGCLIAGGAVTNVIKQAESGRPFSVTSLPTDTVIGGAMGLLGPAAGAVGRILAPAAKGVSAAVSNVIRNLVAKPKPQVRPAATVASKPTTPSNLMQQNPSNYSSSAASRTSPGRGASCNSFVPGTLVLLADGSWVPIEDGRLGDLVLASDPETGVSSAEPVVALIAGGGDKHLVTVTVAGEGGETGSVTATGEHPFWVESTKAWMDAKDLRPGDMLRTSSGTWVQVAAVEYDHREQAVHNLTVGNLHTYFVVAGDTAVLNHNDSCPVTAVQGGINGMEDISSYAAQRTVTAGQGGRIQAHHLIEQRFVDQMGGNANAWATVVLSRADHQLFTNAWRAAIPYGPAGTGSATRGAIENAARVIYANYPNVLRELRLQ